MGPGFSSFELPLVSFVKREGRGEDDTAQRLRSHFLPSRSGFDLTAGNEKQIEPRENLLF